MQPFLWNVALGTTELPPLGMPVDVMWSGSSALPGRVCLAGKGHPHLVTDATRGGRAR